MSHSHLPTANLRIAGETDSTLAGFGKRIASVRAVRSSYVTLRCNYIYIYMVPPGARQPPMLSPAQQPHGGGLAIYDHASRSHMLYLNAGLVLPNRIPPCSVHYCLYAHTIYLQRITAHRIFYSSHILATIKISCALHACWPRTTYIIHYLIHAGGLG